MTNKINSRNRRAKKLRAHSIDLKVNRLSVFRSGKHIYAQVFSIDGKEVIAQASSLDKSIKFDKTGNIEAASKVGEEIGKRAVAKGIEKFLLIDLAISIMVELNLWPKVQEPLD